MQVRKYNIDVHQDANKFTIWQHLVILKTAITGKTQTQVFKTKGFICLLKIIIINYNHYGRPDTYLVTLALTRRKIVTTIVTDIFSPLHYHSYLLYACCCCAASSLILSGNLFYAKLNDFHNLPSMFCESKIHILQRRQSSTNTANFCLS